MYVSRRQILIGSNRFRQKLALGFVVVIFLGTFLAYALDIFQVSGGVVFLAGDAALVGVCAAAVLGYQRSGIAFAWLVVYASLLGFSADHYFLGISARPFSERVAAFLQLDGLVVLAVQALVLGTVAWSAGILSKWIVKTIQNNRAKSHP